MRGRVLGPRRLRPTVSRIDSRRHESLTVLIEILPKLYTFHVDLSVIDWIAFEEITRQLLSHERILYLDRQYISSFVAS